MHNWPFRITLGDFRLIISFKLNYNGTFNGWERIFYELLYHSCHIYFAKELLNWFNFKVKELNGVYV